MTNPLAEERRRVQQALEAIKERERKLKELQALLDRAVQRLA